jgi:hypothetical protein
MLGLPAVSYRDFAEFSSPQTSQDRVNAGAAIDALHE